jgi:hypothetical protein
LLVSTPYTNVKGKGMQPDCYSKGVIENVGNVGDNSISYKMPIFLGAMDGSQTEGQKKFIKVIDAITENVKQYLLKPSTKEEIGKYKLSENDLDKVDPIWYKKEKDVRVEGSTPILYAQLMERKQQISKDTWGDKAIITNFYDLERGVEVDPLSLLNKQCYVTGVIKIESVTISATSIKLKCRMVDAQVKTMNNGRISLLPREPVSNIIYEDEKDEDVEPSSIKPALLVTGDDDDDEEEEEKVVAPVTTEIVESSDEEDEAPVDVKPAVKTVVRKTVAKKK